MLCIARERRVPITDRLLHQNTKKAPPKRGQLWSFGRKRSAEPPARMRQHGVDLALVGAEEGAGLGHRIAALRGPLQQQFELAHVALRVLEEVLVAAQAALDLVESRLAGERIDAA